MKNLVIEELIQAWEAFAATEPNIEPARRATLRECADTLRMILGTELLSSREQNIEDLLRSACAIAERKGTGTAWARFLASANNLGVNGVTARTYRILPSDEQEPT